MSIAQIQLIDEMQKELDILYAENALKLTQILGTLKLLYDVRILDEKDGSPCWCANPEGAGHSFDCSKAREATEAFWKK